MHVTVAITTKRRPKELASLLESLSVQEIPAELTFEVVVVDNDGDGSARAVAMVGQRGAISQIRYIVEPIPGIAAARNRALQMARGDALAFIDDDEYTSPTWLREHARCMVTFGADLVFGPVIPAFDPGVAEWVIRSGVFERRRLRTGQAVDLRDMRSGNVIMSLTWLGRVAPGLSFDRRLGLTGGEDTLFFATARDRQARSVWCDEARAWERVPVARAAARYLIQRWFQLGISSCMIARIREGLPGQVREIGKGLLLMPVGFILGTIQLPFSRRLAASWYKKAVCGIGKVAGGLGHQFQLYSRPAEEP